MYMKFGSTIILRIAAAIIGLVVLAICVLGLPEILRDSNMREYYPIIWGVYTSAIPFFIGLYQVVVLLGYIDRGEAFSQASVNTLRMVKYLAGGIAALYALGMPYIYLVGDNDDAPGVIALGLVIVFASFIVATFAAVLQKLLQSAVDIKSENDLTV